jgi:DNA-binding transcriptional LysR family regulator
MDGNELRTFLAVAESGSFSRAASQLNLTQPAVTKRIQALEQQLGTRLFDRAGRRTFLTDAGELLVPRARELLHHQQDTRTLLQNLSGRVDGALRLATSHHAGLHRLAPVLRAYSRSYPSVRLDIRFVDSEVAHELVQHAEVDLAVVTLNPAGAQGLHCEPLWRDPLQFVAGRDHPLHGRTSITLAEIAAHQAVLPAWQTFTGRIISARFQEAGVEIGPCLSTNYLETIGMLVDVGLGWSVLPATMIAASITVLPVATRPLSRTLGLVSNPYRTLPNSARAFAAAARAFGDQRAGGQSGF